jgi:hypothetical protein
MKCQPVKREPAFIFSQNNRLLSKEKSGKSCFLDRMGNVDRFVRAGSAVKARQIGKRFGLLIRTPKGMPFDLAI